MNTKFHIFLITTKGCKGCQIMDNLLKESLKGIEDKVAYHVSDYTKHLSNSKSKNKFSDFPTTLFVNDGEVKIKLVGSQPVPVIKAKIQIAFGIKPDDSEYVRDKEQEEQEDNSKVDKILNFG